MSPNKPNNPNTISVKIDGSEINAKERVARTISSFLASGSAIANEMSAGIFRTRAAPDSPDSAKALTSAEFSSSTVDVSATPATVLVASAATVMVTSAATVSVTAFTGSVTVVSVAVAATADAAVNVAESANALTNVAATAAVTIAVSDTGSATTATAAVTAEITTSLLRLLRLPQLLFRLLLRFLRLPQLLLGLLRR